MPPAFAGLLRNSYSPTACAVGYNTPPASLAPLRPGISNFAS